MENTFENKAKFFAQYWGQKVLMLKNNDSPQTFTVEIESLTINNKEFDIKYLELKPLQSITDEDAIEVAKIVLSDTINMNDFYNLLHNIKTDPIKVISIKTECYDYSDNGYYHTTIETNAMQMKVVIYDDGEIIASEDGEEFKIYSTVHSIDYLRSKGYALPYMDISVKQQIKWGWIKLIEQ